MMEIMRVTSRLQKAVMEKRLKDQDNVMNWILSQVCSKNIYMLKFNMKCRPFQFPE